MDILALYEFIYWTEQDFSSISDLMLDLKDKHPDWFEQEPTLKTILDNLREGRQQAMTIRSTIEEQARKMLESAG